MKLPKPIQDSILGASICMEGIMTPNKLYRQVTHLPPQVDSNFTEACLKAWLHTNHAINL